MGKLLENKKEKQRRLFDTAFYLFMEKGVQSTTIQDIVQSANIAKGTFYLYYKDKKELINEITIKKSHELLQNAIEKGREKNIINTADKAIFIINNLIDNLTEDKKLLKFLYKNLSEGLYEKAVNSPLEKEEKSLVELFSEDISKKGIDAEITFFMILELVGATCYNSILYNKPLPIAEYKPYLFNAVRKLL